MQSAIDNASAGDTITLATGTYLNNVLNIGTGKITIIPATPGGVFLNGTNDIKISGDSVTFSGFQFTSGTISANVIEVSGNYNTLTQLNFNGYSANHLVVISGQHNFVTYCNFQNKPALNLINHGGTSDMLQIIPDSTKIGYNTIRYCSFQLMLGFGCEYGNECLRIGDGAFST